MAIQLCRPLHSCRDRNKAHIKIIKIKIFIGMDGNERPRVARRGGSRVAFGYPFYSQDDPLEVGSRIFDREIPPI